MRADRAHLRKEHKAAGTLNCYADGFDGFRCDFVTGDVSTRDYFQPSTSGQATIAAATWNVGAHVSILPSMESTGSLDILKLKQRSRMGATDAKNQSSPCDRSKARMPMAECSNLHTPRSRDLRHAR